MLKNLNIKLPDDPATPLLWVYAQKNSRDSWKRYLFTITEGFFTTAKRWKLSKCPLADEWISKMYYKCTMDYYSAFKRNEILKRATITMKPEHIIWNKPDTKGQIRDSTYIRYLEQTNSCSQKLKWWWTEAGREENGELVFNGYRASIWDKKVLETDRDSGYCIIYLKMAKKILYSM